MAPRHAPSPRVQRYRGHRVERQKEPQRMEGWKGARGQGGGGVGRVKGCQVLRRANQPTASKQYNGANPWLRSYESYNDRWQGWDGWQGWHRAVSVGRPTSDERCLGHEHLPRTRHCARRCKLPSCKHAAPMLRDTGMLHPCCMLHICCMYVCSRGSGVRRHGWLPVDDCNVLWLLRRGAMLVIMTNAV